MKKDENAMDTTPPDEEIDTHRSPTEPLDLDAYRNGLVDLLAWIFRQRTSEMNLYDPDTWPMIRLIEWGATFPLAFKHPYLFALAKHQTAADLLGLYPDQSELPSDISLAEVSASLLTYTFEAGTNPEVAFHAVVAAIAKEIHGTDEESMSTESFSDKLSTALRQHRFLERFPGAVPSAKEIQSAIGDAPR